MSGILKKKRNKSFEIFLSVWWNFSKLAWRSLSVKILSNERKYHDVLCVVWTTNLTIITAVIKVINLSNASWSSTSKVLSLSKLAHYGAKNILNAHLKFENHIISGNICLLCCSNKCLFVTEEILITVSWQAPDKPQSLLFLTPRPALSSHQYKTLVCLFWSGNLSTLIEIL